MRVTARTGDVLSITRAQESTPARSVLAGWRIFNGLTQKMVDDIEALVASGSIPGAPFRRWYDNFTRANGAIGTAPSGQVYEPSPSGAFPQIIGNRIAATAGGFGYVGVPLAEIQELVGLDAVFSAAATNLASTTISIGNGPDVGGNINNAVHCYFTPTSWAIQKRVANVSTNLRLGTFATPLTCDNVTKYRFEVAIIGDLVIIALPDGKGGTDFAAARDSSIPSLNGPYVYIEIHSTAPGADESYITGAWSWAREKTYGSPFPGFTPLAGLISDITRTDPATYGVDLIARLGRSDQVMAGRGPTLGRAALMFGSSQDVGITRLSAGVLTMESQATVFRPSTAGTASLPAASLAQGAIAYDSSLNRLVSSDGVNWNAYATSDLSAPAIQDDFNGVDGNALVTPKNWSSVVLGGAAAAAATYSGQRLKIATGATGGRVAADYVTINANIPNLADVDVLLKYEFGSAGTVERYLNLLVRYDGANNYYRLINSIAGGNFLAQVGKKVAGANTTLGTVAAGTAPAGSTYFMRFRVLGSTITAKWWSMGVAEPSLWTVTYTDADVSAAGGITLLATGGVAATSGFDYLHRAEIKAL